MIHYELILLFALGFAPKDVIRGFGYSRGSAYRFYRIYRDARKRAVSRLTCGNSVSPAERSRATNLGEKRKRVRRSRGEKPMFADPKCLHGAAFCIDPLLRDKNDCEGCLNNPETDET